MVYFHLYWTYDPADAIVKFAVRVSCDWSMDGFLMMNLSDRRVNWTASCTKPIALIELEIDGTPVVAVACSSRVFKGT